MIFFVSFLLFEKDLSIFVFRVKAFFLRLFYS